MFVWVSALWCAADCGAVSMCLRQLQIMRNGLAAGGWSNTQAHLPCFTVALTNGFGHSPKTTAMQLAQKVKLDGNLRTEPGRGKQTGDLPCITLQCFC